MTNTIVAMLRRQVTGNGDRPALETRVGSHWISRSFREWDETALAVAAALADLGVSHGDRVAILSSTRREWAEVDMGIVSAGAVVVPIYQQTTPEGVAHVLEDSGSVVVFAEDPMQIEKLFAATSAEQRRAVRRIVYFDGRRRFERPDPRGRLEVRLEDVVPREERAKVMAYAELLEAGRRLLDREESTIRARGDRVVPDDIATIVYTSGTTGLPRGVLLSHKNFAAETGSVREVLGLTNADRTLLFLPLAHIFAKALLVASVRVGFSTAFATSLTSALDEMREVEPTFFAAVPRVFEKVYASVLAKIDGESPLRRRVAERALSVGREVSEIRRNGGTIGPILAAQHRAADLAVLERIRHVFGKRLRFALSGAAPLSREVAEFFHSCDVLILEGYGLTETTAATHVNRPDAFKLGTVGLPAPGIEVKLDRDGEVLVRGDSVMVGYRNDPDATSVALDEDRWFRTGDIGTIDREGFLTITDRKKDLIVTAGGKNVAPQNIERLLEASPLVSRAVVIGDRRPYLVALITVDDEAARAYAAREGLVRGDRAWGEHPKVASELDAIVRRVNANLENYQQIKRWAVLPRDLEVEAGELTPTLKVRRKVVVQRFEDRIEALYSGRDRS
ncbi:MAG: long-chain fatty acid--CoA ligase [Myxococcales bacterium]|nr:long-chain fatty acid--CoA ligase [Myxococcales bacterium]